MPTLTRVAVVQLPHNLLEFFVPAPARPLALDTSNNNLEVAKLLQEVYP